MTNKIKSRKFWMAVLSGALVVANEGLDLKLPSESIMTVGGIAAAYVLGQGYTDGQQAKKDT